MSSREFFYTVDCSWPLVIRKNTPRAQLNRKGIEMVKGAIELRKENFEKEVTKSKLPVLIDFWADWCSPCKVMSPVLEEIAKEYSGKIKVGKLDVDACPELAAEYEVMSIPTLLFFKDGQQGPRLVGIVSKSKIEKKIRELI